MICDEAMRVAKNPEGYRIGYLRDALWTLFTEMERLTAEVVELKRKEWHRQAIAKEGDLDVTAGRPDVMGERAKPCGSCKGPDCEGCETADQKVHP